MTQMSVTGTLSDLVTEAENSLTEPSVGQRDGAPAETDSDSGDSLFITQKPVPEAVRSGRRRCSSFRSDPPSLADADGSDDSASPEESKTDRKKKSKRIKLPKHSFSFLRQRRTGRIRIEELKIKQNTSLHNAVMGGFFKSVRDLWESYQRNKDLTSLPTVDKPGESIPPISEEEEEKPEDEDIRVVEKKRFVVSLKAKCSRPWCTSKEGGGQEEERRGGRSMKARHETSRGEQRNMLAPKSREILSTDTSSDEEEESSSRALVERKMSDKQVTSAVETPKAKKRKENEDDSSASVCELSPNGPEASADVAEPREDDFLTDELPQMEQAECEPEGQNLLQTDASDDTMCSHEAVEEEKGQSDESQHDVSFTEVEETPRVSQTIAEPEIHEINATEGLSHDDNIITVEERDIPGPKKKKKRKKKNKLAAEGVREEEDGHLESNVREEEEDGVFSGSCTVEKKKKKTRNEDNELLKSNLQSEPVNDVAEKPKKKKKKKKDLTSEPTEQLREVEDCLEEASQETRESSYVEGKKPKKKQKASSSDHVEGDDCMDVSLSSEVKTGVSVKKKKKKKKNTQEDENSAQNTTEGGEDQDAELLRILSKDTVAQSDNSVSVQKKKKKRTSSFLVADAEENAAQTHEETPAVAAYSWPADKPAGESAETTGSLEKADDVVRKKRKKRKKVSAEQEKAEEDFEEPDRTCQTAAAETGDERKKKRRRDDSESVTSVEIAERASDSQAAKQKKKKKKDTQEIPSTTTENNESEESTRNICVPLSHKKKSSIVAAKGINETWNDSRAADDQAARKTLPKQASPSSETPENQAGNDVRGKKKKKKVKEDESVLLERKPFTETDEIKAPKPKKKDRTQPAAESSLSSVFSDSSLCQSETTSSHSGTKNKQKKAKHRRFNQIEDFITVG